MLKRSEQTRIINLLDKARITLCQSALDAKIADKIEYKISDALEDIRELKVKEDE